MAVSAGSADAQNFLNRLKDKAIDAAESNIENRVHHKTNEVIDDALDGNGKDKNNKGNKGNKGNNDNYEGQDDNNSQTSETTQPKKPQDKKALEMEYAKSDFVSGDEVFFMDDFNNEQVGEFASQWDLRYGTAEVAVINGKKAFYFSEASTEIEPLMTNQESYLPDAFTLEFDFFAGDGSVLDADENRLRGEYFINLRSNEDGNLGEISVSPAEDNGVGTTRWMVEKSTSGGIQGDAQMSNTTAREWNHFALSFNKRALKVYINGVRMCNLPNVAAPARFTISRAFWGDHHGNYITNVKLCKGAVPLYDRLASEGKIVSYGITFETGKADLKPESMAEIARIAKLMQEKPELKFEVQGHCDNQGSDAVNDPLSQKRAEAIVNALASKGIAKTRLTAVGKGSHNPLADNSTEEGRAKNRRVEFVKK